LASVICYALLMLSGAAVRLTGSGLGCPDWPSCYHTQFTAHVSFHPMVEFVNRCVTSALTAVSVLALVVAFARTPRRLDLCWLAGGLAAGVAGQIVLGGIVVLFKLNPYLVACHFLLTIVILADAVVLYHQSGIGPEHDETRSEPTVTPDLRWLGRLLLATLAVLSTAGTMVTGAGPHAGAPSAVGQPIERVDIAFRAIAELHSDFALFLIGLTLASLFAFHHAKVPAEVERRLRILFELMVIQGTIGYMQYFLHDDPVVVEFHIAGVTALWITAVGFYLSLHRHREREAPVIAALVGSPAAVPAAVPAG
jgi:cytochrome c oxidase assembly protein subunit 15